MTQPTSTGGQRAGRKPEIVCWNCGLFQHCHSTRSDPATEGLRSSLRVQRQVLRRGEQVFRPGDAFRFFCVITSGSLKTYLTASERPDQISGFHLAGDVIGLEALHAGKHACGARALEISSVCKVEFEHLSRPEEPNSLVQHQLLQIMSRRICTDMLHCAVLCRKSADERLAAFLLDLSVQYHHHGLSPREFRLAMSRGDIANYLGLAEETVSRQLSRLVERGLITVARRRIVLNKMPDLVRMAGLPAFSM